MRLPALRTVLRLTLPLVAATVLQTLVNVVDVFMAGRLGPLEVAAVGMAGSVRLLILVVVMAMTGGAMSLAAQAKGARNPQALEDVTRQTMLLALGLALFLSLVGVWLARPMMLFLNGGGPAEVVEAGSAYLVILFAGTELLVMHLALTSSIQGTGDTVTPLWVPGAALGTLLARLIGLRMVRTIIGRDANVIR